MTDIYFKIPRGARIFILFLLIISIAYFLVYFLTPERIKIPEEFLKARKDASLIAEEIIVISNETAGNIAVISELDGEAKYAEALRLISGEIERNRQAREKAVDLSKRLELMARNLSGIYPASAGQIALEALSSETALISRLISYNDYLFQLMNFLKEKFVSDAQNTNGEVAELIKKINKEAKTINDLDKNFNDLMEKFDASVNK